MRVAQSGRDMVRAYHFLPENMVSDEDMCRGDPRPWWVGETRDYRELFLEAGDGEIICVAGYASAPSLWSAMLHADGPIACLVEVSTPFKIEVRWRGSLQISVSRRLVAAQNAAAQLQQFAFDCADRSIAFLERLHADSKEPRRTLERTGRPWKEKIKPNDSRATVAPHAANLLPAVAEMANLVATRLNSTNVDEIVDAAVLASDLGIEVARCTIEDPCGKAEYRWQQAYFELLFGRLFQTANRELTHKLLR